MNKTILKHGDKLFIFCAWLFSIAIITLSKESPSLHISELAYSINRAILAIIILYYLLPKYFENRHYWKFGLLIAICFILFGAIEEGLIEVYFLPDTKGAEGLTFRGILYFCMQAFPLMSLLTAIKLFWNYNLAIQKMNIIERDRVQNELKFLKAQINPHILFNTLNNLYCYVIENKPGAPDMILKLSDLLRYMLYECSDNKVLLDKELSAVANYIALQKIGLEDRANISIEIKGLNRNYKISPFILITIIENCFKHSMNTLTDGITINITININEGSMLSMLVENNFDPNKSIQSTVENRQGIGIANIEKQLRLIHGDNFKIKNRVDDSMYIVDLSIPLLQ